MLERYRNAANGNLDYIKKFLRSNPREINNGWNGTGKIISQNEQSVLGGSMAGINVAAILVNPILALPLFGIEYLAIKKYADAYVSKRLGWTLLEFAAEKGQCAVAAYLILAGADTNNKFITIAITNGHENFVTLCTKAIEKRAKIIHMKNTIDELESYIDELRSNLNITETDLLKIQVDFINLVETVTSKKINSNEDSANDDDLSSSTTTPTNEEVASEEDGGNCDITHSQMPSVHNQLLTMRYGLFKYNKENSEAMNGLFKKTLQSTGLALGVALGEGDCFFDAVAQGLNELKGTKKYTIKNLRHLCGEYVKSGKHPWVKKALIKDEGGEAGYNQYLAKIQYTAAEMEEKEGDDSLSGGAVWGRQEIEGRIICEELRIKMHVIEGRTSVNGVHGALLSHQLISAGRSCSIEEQNIDYSESNLIHLAVINNHFVPILRKVTEPTTVNIDKLKSKHFFNYSQLHSTSTPDNEEINSEEDCEVIYPSQAFFSPPKKTPKKPNKENDFYDDLYSTLTPQR